ncbi:MAG: ThiF family adenylyltransferase [Syntrophales bacterium]|nr:ThiF family adenylyltransferase [Syntrophales bacterium]
MMSFYEILPFDDVHVFPDELAIIKSAILQCSGSLGGLFSYETEGFLGEAEAIVLNIQIDVPTRSPFGVLEEEKIAISYSKNNNEGLQAYALRKDFPNLPHLNLTYKDAPKSLCLFDVPAMDKIYNESLLHFIIRVKQWLDRAASGELHLDVQAMEPFIMGGLGHFVFDSETWERIISCSSDYELYLSRPAVTTRKDNHYVEVCSADIGKKGPQTPFAFLTMKGNPTSDQCINYLPKNYLELHDLLDKKIAINLDEEIFNFISTIYGKGLSKKYHDKSLIIIICIPRLNLEGMPVDHEIVVFQLLPSNVLTIGKALGCIHEIKRKNETIHVLENNINRKKEELEKVVPVPFSVIRPFSQKLAKEMAGITENISDITISAVGLGALGSQVVLNLARQGFSKWKLIDNDILLPHNFARHDLSAYFRGEMKAEALEHELKVILEKTEVESYVQKIDDISSKKEEKKIFESEILIDATASYSAFLKLAYRDDIRPRNISIYYCNGGLTSVLLAENEYRNIRLDDIDLQLKIKGLDHENINNIYRTREENQLIYSTSCSSQTAVVAQDCVAIHGGILTRQIKKVIFNKTALAYINSISEVNSSVKVTEVIPSEVIVKEQDLWQFRISQFAVDEMNEYRNQKLPNETGGVLIGWINSHEKVIYIGKALPAPPDSNERPYSFIRGKDGLYKKVQEIKGISNNDLYYVGEWHSHPHNASVSQSGSDRKSIVKLSEIMLEDTLPGVMIILGDSKELGWYVCLG